MTTTTQMTPGQAEDAVLQLNYDIVDIARARAAARAESLFCI